MGHGLIQALLHHGAHVRATQFQKRKIALTHRNLEVVTCDLRSQEEAQAAFQNMDIAFLAAAWVGSAKSVKEDPSSLIMYNLELQSKCIHWAAKWKLYRCGFISSSYLYPDTGKPNVEEEGFEGNPWMPVNYGLGWFKRYLETLCKHFHMTSQTDYAVIRPTTVYGPFDHFDLERGHAIPALIVKAVNRMDPFEVWGNGQDVRSFTYVDDVVEGSLLMVERYAVAEALNLCSRESHTIRDVVGILLNYLEFHPKVVYSTQRPSAIPYKVSDPSRAREFLRWEAKVGLEEGLKRTIDWYMKHKSPSAPLGTVESHVL